MVMKNFDHSFTLGEHVEGNKTFKFCLSHHKYYIIECMDEQEDKVLQQISNMTKAYEEWNKIKRPEKLKKGM